MRALALKDGGTILDVLLPLGGIAASRKLSSLLEQLLHDPAVAGGFIRAYFQKV